LQTVAHNKGKYLHHVEFDRDIMRIYSVHDGPAWFSLSQDHDAADLVSLGYDVPDRFVLGHSSLYTRSDVTMGPPNSLVNSTVISALRGGVPHGHYASYTYQQFTGSPTKSRNAKSTQFCHHILHDVNGKYLSAFNAFSHDDILDAISQQPQRDRSRQQWKPQYRFSYSGTDPTDDSTAMNIGRNASLLTAVLSHFQHHSQSRRHYLSSPPASPDWLALRLDHRAQPLKLEGELKRCRQCLSKPFPNAPAGWSTWWFETRYQLASRRRIIAAYIRANRFKSAHFGVCNTPRKHSSPPRTAVPHLHQSGLNPTVPVGDGALASFENDYHVPQTRRNYNINVTPKQLKSAKKQLSRVFSHLDIYRGDTIDQLPVSLLLTQVFHSSQINWTYHGDPSRLVLPSRSSSQGFFESVFQKLF
jgi:hypothetical protein